MQQKTRPPTDKKENEIWTTFTYHSPKIRAVTNIFRNTNIKIAFKTAETTQKIIKPHRQNPTSAYEKSGIYKLTCKTCKKAYVGQTSRNLRARHQEHTRYIKNNDPRSAYALHILNNKHEYGTMEETMTLLKKIDKQSLLLPTEQLYIQTMHGNNELIPEQIPKYSGVDSRVVVWIREFLLGRTQRVRVGGQLSAEVRVMSGVPQGSVLGPLLFLAYVNDIWRNMESTIRLFADDSVIYKKIINNADKEILQKDLDRLGEWAVVNEMKINPSKVRQFASRKLG